MHSESEERDTWESGTKFDINIENNNGSVFCDKHFIPEELLSLILIHVPLRSLAFTCRLVCKHWTHLVDNQVWKTLLKKKNVWSPILREKPWPISYSILKNNFLYRNLVRNNNGEEGLKYWKTSDMNNGNSWKVEAQPINSNAYLQELQNEIHELTTCFAAAYNSCSMEQTIDLKKEGASPFVMDNLQPEITVSEWYSAHSDSRCVYKFQTALLDQFENIIDEFSFQTNLDKPDGAIWKKVTHSFKNYGKGVRYVWICHFGQDLLFWKGQHGSKMTGTSVILALPS